MKTPVGGVVPESIGFILSLGWLRVERISGESWYSSERGAASRGKRRAPSVADGGVARQGLRKKRVTGSSESLVWRATVKAGFSGVRGQERPGAAE